MHDPFAYSVVLYQPLAHPATLTTIDGINLNAGAHSVTITPEIVCKLIDPTACSYEFAPGRWSVWGDQGQPLAMDSGHLDGIDYDFPTEIEAWQAAFRFLLDHTPQTAA